MPSALIAGAGLTLALLCSFIDGALAADQMQPVFVWLRDHLPNILHTGWLTGLVETWPQPYLRWSALLWIGVGLALALTGKVGIFPALRLARRVGPRTPLFLQILVLLASLGGGKALLSYRATGPIPSQQHALTSSARTLSSPGTSGEKGP